jgi:hypothetical protein
MGSFFITLGSSCIWVFKVPLALFSNKRRHHNHVSFSSTSRIRCSGLLSPLKYSLIYPHCPDLILHLQGQVSQYLLFKCYADSLSRLSQTCDAYTTNVNASFYWSLNINFSSQIIIHNYLWDAIFFHPYSHHLFL